MSIQRLRWVAVVMSLSLASPVFAADWHVNPAGTGDAPTIQAAFDAASPGDTIILAPGVYMDSHTRTIQGHSQPQTTTAVAFMSPGVDITSSGGAEVTIIDGELDHHGLFGTDLGVSTISEITFYQCTRAGGEIWGGGVMLHRSDPVIEHCWFEECEGHVGGGIMLSQGVGATVRFNVFVHNEGGWGGAFEIFDHVGAVLENNTFIGNTASRGGAVMLNATTIDLSNNIFYGNVTGNGGAVACHDGAVVTGTCGLYWNNAGGNVEACGIVIGQNDNLSANPSFCDVDGGNYQLRSDSPGSPDHPSGCGLRGALPVGCGPVAVQSTSWGSIKSAYR